MSAFAVGTQSTRRSSALLLLQIYVVFVTLIPARLIIDQIGAFGSPASIVGMVAFAMWAVAAARPGTLPRRVVAVRVAVVATWIPFLVSYAVFHLNIAPADEVNSADRRLLFMLAWSGVALLAAEGLRDRSEVMRLLRVTVACAAATSAIAFLQSRVGIDLTRPLLYLPGLSVNGDYEAILARGGWARAAGTATHPLELGTMLAMTLGPAIVLATSDRGWSRGRRVTAACLIALAVPISISRSAIISLFIVAICWFVAADFRARLRGAATALGFLVVLFLVIPGLLGFFRNIFGGVGSDASVSMRTDDYSALAPYIRHSPWIGRGPGTFLPKYRVVDNQWLVTLVDSGVLGVVGMLIFFGTTGWLGLSLRRTERRDPLMSGLGQAFVGGAAVMIWACCTFDLYGFQMTSAFVALLLGLAGAFVGTGAELTSTVPPRVGQRGAARELAWQT